MIPYTTAVIGSGIPSQPQRFDLNLTTLDQLTAIACMPRDQRPTYNNRGQCIFGSYMQSTTAPYNRARSTTSYISTSGPIVHDITRSTPILRHEEAIAVLVGFSSENPPKIGIFLAWQCLQICGGEKINSSLKLAGLDCEEAPVKNA